MTTEEIINDLRNYSKSSMPFAIDRLEELQRELSKSIKELNKTVADLIKQRDDALKNQQATTVVRQVTTRLEPSRLEIAAMIYAGVDCRAVEEAFEAADKLIAVAKGAK